MRVLHVISTLNIGSGIANYVMNYYRKIINYNIQFDFLAFCRVPKGFEEEVKLLGGKIYYIESPKLKTVLKYNRAVKEFFKKHSGEWECVHIHEILVQKYIIKNSKKFGKVKKILTHSHASKFVLPDYGISPLKNKIKMCVKRIRNFYLLRGINCKSYYHLACSKEAGIALYSKRNLMSDKFRIIKNAIDSNEYIFDENIRAIYRSDFGVQAKKVITLVGRLCYQKNIIFMLDVFKSICVADNSYVLMLVGDGELRSIIEKRVSEYALSENVILLGNRTDVKNILQATDLFVLPSISEGLGIVLIEAQASGLPCIASSSIPKCVKITPHLEFIDLDKGAEYWAKRILNVQLLRYDNSEFVRENGYDISSNLQNIVDIYSEKSTD